MAWTRVERGIFDLGSGPNPYLVRIKIDGKYVTDTAPTAKAARDLRARLETQRSRGDGLDPHLGRVTFQEFTEKWLEGREGLQVANTSARLESSFRIHIFPRIGSKRLANIKQMDIEALITKMLKEPYGPRQKVLAYSTMKVLFFNVASAFKAAIRNGYIAKSPCADIKLPRPPASEKVDPLEPEHVGLIADEMYDYLEGAVLFEAATGLRPGELFGLPLDPRNLDLRNRLLHVRQQIQTPRNGGGAYLCPPKTAASDRTIPLSDAAVRVLNEHLEKHGTHVFEIPWGEPPKEGTRDTREVKTVELIFASYTFRDPGKRRDGKVWSPMRRRQMGFAWEMATRNYAFPDAAGWHSLRHFHASSLIEGGESIIAVQQRLGHNSAKITLDTYGHLFKENHDKTRLVMNEAMAQVLGARRPNLRVAS